MLLRKTKGGFIEIHDRSLNPPAEKRSFHAKPPQKLVQANHDPKDHFKVVMERAVRSSDLVLHNVLASNMAKKPSLHRPEESSKAVHDVAWIHRLHSSVKVDPIAPLARPFRERTFAFERPSEFDDTKRDWTKDPNTARGKKSAAKVPKRPTSERVKTARV